MLPWGHKTIQTMKDEQNNMNMNKTKNKDQTIITNHNANRKTKIVTINK